MDFSSLFGSNIKVKIKHRDTKQKYWAIREANEDIELLPGEIN